MTTPENLLELWLAMHAQAVAGASKEFRAAMDLFNRVYKRAGYADQGEFHMLLAADHKRAMA